MPDLRQLKALHAVAEHGSFSAAADALNYTQPAVSKTIAGLERELGAVLVERGCRPVRLTEAGSALARHADEVFAQLASARSEIDAITQVGAGTVAIGTFSSAGATFVTDALCAFRRLHPNVDVVMAEGTPSAMVRRLRTGELDLAVVWDLPQADEDATAGLEATELLQDPFAVVLHPGHPAAARSRVPLSALAGDRWLLPSFIPDGPSARVLGVACAAAGFQPNVAYRVNDCQMTKAMVAAGEGVSLIPSLMLDGDSATVAVRRIDGPGIARRVSAVRLPGRYESPAAAAFLAVLRQAAADHRGPWPKSAVRKPRSRRGAAR